MQTLSVISSLLILFSSCNHEKTGSLSEERKMLINSCLMNISHGISEVIDYNEKLLLDTNMNLISFNDLFKAEGQKKVLMFKFDTKSCDICLRQEMSLIAKLNKKYLESIVLLVGTNNINEFKIIKEEYKNILSVYGVREENSIVSSIESKLLPYYFLVEDDKPLRMIFIPDKNLPYLSESYLNHLFTNYII